MHEQGLFLNELLGILKYFVYDKIVVDMWLVPNYLVPRYQ